MSLPEIIVPEIILPEIILDVSRLLSRVMHPTPTGVDRVEMAYARGLLAAAGDRLAFAAVHPSGFYGRLSRKKTVAFLDATERRWRMQGDMGRTARLLTAARDLARLRPGRDRPTTDARVYVQASPHHLIDQRKVAAILSREQARFVCLVHDLIPIEHPEYARPGGADLHRARIATVASQADGIIVNSAATGAALQPHLRQAGRTPKVRVAHLGVDPIPAAPDAALPRKPYFVYVSTIEPRKNHLLLLNLWRRLGEHSPGSAPRLVLIGRRGWENEMVIDMLERCLPLRPLVEERSGLADREVAALVAGARAMLYPSFAEGFGMPVAEALIAGTPVICSDLPALREAGGDVPEYLDPLDGPGWWSAIRHYASPKAPRREAQLRRLAHWQAPDWNTHVATVLALTQEVVA